MILPAGSEGWRTRPSGERRLLRSQTILQRLFEFIDPTQFALVARGGAAEGGHGCLAGASPISKTSARPGCRIDVAVANDLRAAITSGRLRVRPTVPFNAALCGTGVGRRLRRYPCAVHFNAA